ncbi:alpha/beta fold hydrolase [Streptosporangium sp. NPDC048047]|uniref:alpha/beta fold hydrolase n=1 Tax=Streptosporangium sp. NPDC048047 TaxID=3155748 RepID=UPI0034190239
MPETTPPAPAFRTPEAGRRFAAAYARVLARWPAATEEIDVRSEYGTTRVLACGPADAPPLVLSHGGGATSAVWFANAAALASAHRVYAIDRIGEPGHGARGDRPIRDEDDLLDWLEATFAGLGLDRADLCGHSYGAEIALAFALRAPHLVRRLALLDPTRCFTGFSPRYLLRALPTLLRPTPRRVRALTAWESGGTPVDEGWLELYVSGATDLPRSRIIPIRRPDAALLPTSAVPTLVVAAERSRAHDARAVVAGARRLMPHAGTAVLPDVSHHGIPTERPEALNRLLLEFFAPEDPEDLT